MASSSKLVITCETAAGDKNFSYNYSNPEVSSARVVALGNGLVTNASIFKHSPLVFKAAKVVTTTETDIDISE